MNALLKQLATKLHAELYNRRNEIIGRTGRFPKEQLFLALNDCRPILDQVFGGPARSRRAVSRKMTVQKRTRNKKRKKQLEYLVDYSISRYFITQAIRQSGFEDPELEDGQFYEILLAVESELGDDNEVLRDFLKLLDIKARIKCLIFYRRPNEPKTKALYDRINWVVSHHGSFNPEEGFLFVGLPKPNVATLLIHDFEFGWLKDKKVVPLE